MLIIMMLITLFPFVAKNEYSELKRCYINLSAQISLVLSAINVAINGIIVILRDYS